ncbi:MAG TPA: 23S rRNA (uracil(1939)-C(5))-methyltransferase RlmD [bacterium]|nr:23S rRNA (uracil(1939)-C(5))-methyltransferase RlmD [bacterium]
MEELSVKIEKAIFEGRYLSHLPNGQVLLLEGFAQPGEIVKVGIYKKKKDYCEGRILEVETAVEGRITPPCPYFGRCGGCQYQHLEYERQLTLKTAILAENLRQGAKIQAWPGLNVVGAPEIWRYRNKIELNFVDDDFGFALGQCYKGSFYKIVDLDDCLLFPEPVAAIIKAAKEWRQKYALSCFDRHHFVGFLRHLVIRHAHHTNQWMIIIVTSDDYPENYPDNTSLQKLFKDFLNFLPKDLSVTSFYHRLIRLQRRKRESYTDTLLAGKAHIIEKLLDLDYQISSDAFFQNNTVQAERLIEELLGHCGQLDQRPILDLYCGVGTFTLPLARLNPQRKIHGLELVASAVAAAQANARLNNLDNLEFLVGDASKMVKQLRDHDFGAIVVDPPRSGLDPVVVAFLLEMKTPHIFYISCNPVTLSRDLALLSPLYEAKVIKGFDLFPQTYHLESFVRLDLK